MLFVVAAFVIFVGAPTPANTPEIWEIPGDHYEWLLSSPYRPYLSGAAENYLSLKFGPEGGLPGDRVESEGLVAGQNIRVNDRSQDENPSLTTQSETAVEVFGNTVVLGWNDIGQFFQSQSLVGYGYSHDGGQTYTDGGFLPPVRGGANLGDPDIAVDRHGHFYYSTISLDADGIGFIGVSKSVDGGRTFSEPVSASTTVSSVDSFQDKEMMAVDNTGGEHDGNVYISWTRFGPEGIKIMFSRSINGGLSFETPIAITAVGTNVSGSIPRVGPNGEVYVVWERFDTPGIYISRSLDGGRTFGTDGVAEVLVSDLEYIGQPASPNTCEGRQILNGYVDAAFEFPTMAVSPVNGDVFVSFNSNPDGIDESDVFLARSTDGGFNWSEPIRLNDDNTLSDQFMPAMTVAPNGVVAVTWYDRRHDAENLDFDLYMALSLDHGQNWLPNRRITTSTSPVPPLGPNFDAIRPCYMGDYNDIVADENSFYIAWGDNRAEGRTWETLAPMPVPREATTNVALGNSIFVIGGTHLGFGEKGESRANDRYSTSTRQWSSHMPIPTARAFAGGVTAGFSIYVAGGQSSRYGGVTGAFERFDALWNRWVELEPMPTPRTDLGAARVGDKLYFMGGQDCVSPTCGQTLNVVEIYDLKRREWTTGTPMPQRMAGFSTTVIQGKIYVVGGYNRSGVYTTQVNAHRSVLEYNPASDLWLPRGALPAGRIAPAVSNCGEKLMISGGLNDQNFSLVRRNAWSFDTSTDTWAQIPAPKVDRNGIDAVTVKNKIYVIGGSSNARVPYLGANEVYNCATGGSARPDPDIIISILPVPDVRASARSHESIEFDVQTASRSRSIEFRVNVAQTLGSVQLEVYNLSGVEVFDSGETNGPVVQWNLSTKRGRLAANGVYLYRITARDLNGKLIQSEVSKVLVLR